MRPRRPSLPTPRTPRGLRLIVGVAAMAAVLAGCSTSTDGEASASAQGSASTQASAGDKATTAAASTSEAVVGAGAKCGTVTFATGAEGTVVVERGSTTCADAVALIKRYQDDPAITRTGNTNSAMFDGWACSSPTAAAAKAKGYGTSCANSEVTIIVVPGSAASAAGERPCTIAAINEDLGRQPAQPPRCHPGWAYVDWGQLGDSQSLVRVVDGSWQVYAAFPSSTCVDKARADGVPDQELGSFPPCAPAGAGAGGQGSGGQGAADLGLATPITRPSCDGMGIVVLHSAITPGDYASEVGRALSANPGASYLRTDQSCPSLRQQSDNGTPIYAVFKPAGRTKAEVCAAVRREGGGAYGKWLDTTSDPTQIIAC